MSDVFVQLPFGLEDEDGRRGVHCESGTVRETLAAIAARFDKAGNLIFRPDGSVRVTIIVNGCRVDDESLDSRLKAGDSVALLPYVRSLARH